MPDPKITDKESLERWLEGRPREDAVAIAYRAAMRIAPPWWIIVDERLSDRSVAEPQKFLRALLATGVAQKYRQSESEAILVLARKVDTLASATQDNAGLTVARALETVFHARAPLVASLASARAAEATASAAVADLPRAPGTFLLDVSSFTWPARASVYSLIGSDCTALMSGVDVMKQPLWNDRPDWSISRWDQILSEWVSRNPIEYFWLTWYEKALRGEHDWPLLQSVALISDADWEKGRRACRGDH